MSNLQNGLAASSEVLVFIHSLAENDGLRISRIDARRAGGTERETMKLIISLAVVVLLFAGSTAAQDLTPQAREIMARPDLARAFAHVEATRDRILGEWRALTEINAPSGKEHERAEAVRKLLATCKLDKVYFDSNGNLIAIRRGRMRIAERR